MVSFELPACVEARRARARGQRVHIGNEWEVKTTHQTRSLHELTTWAVSATSRCPRCPLAGHRSRTPTSNSSQPTLGRPPVTARRPGNDRLCRAQPQGVTQAHSNVGSLVLDQVGHSLRDIWRSRTALLWTFGMPLLWMLLIGALVGPTAIDPVSGRR